MKPDIVVVGAGLFGLTIAERCARWDLNVLIIERRDHIGGNAWTEYDKSSGIEVHKYGAHLFHTDNERVWNYVNQFTDFTDYEHRVWARSRGEIYPLPFSLGLINQLYRLDLGPEQARKYIEEVARLDSELFDSHDPANLAEKAISMVGYGIYSAFIEGYTRKQWETDPVDLSPDIISRIPVRFNYDTRYFTDKYQGQPTDGYVFWFNQMVAHPNIKIELNSEFQSDWFPETLVIYTGPLDAYFDYSHGHLPWRTVDFEFEHLAVDDYQGTAVINECDSHVPYTRTIEFKHFHPERNEPGQHARGKTIIAREYSRRADVGDEPYYPVPGETSRAMLSEYRILAEAQGNVLFGGRLGTYQYLDMHMAIASALTMFDNKIRPMFPNRIGEG